MQHPQLVVLHREPCRAHPRARVVVDPGHGVDEVGRTQHRPAQPGVGPHAVLHVGDHDQPPLAAHRGLGGEQRDGVVLRRPLGEGVGRDLLLREGLDERGGARAGQPLAEPGRGLEQRHHGVEVAVGPPAAPPTGERAAAPSLGEPGGRPDRPEQLLGRRAGRGGRRRDHRTPGGEGGRGALQRLRPAAPAHGLGGVEEGVDEQGVAGSRSPGRALGGEQVLAQPAQPEGVGPADG